jgi:DNA-binding FadR family transcriptional regulator
MTTAHTALDIARALAADVHAGVYQPQEMFPSERDLCVRYSVGRSVVREAFTLLHGMGLSDQTKGKRPRVVAPRLSNVMHSVSEAAKLFFSGAEGLAHLEQARLLLETSMLRYTVEHATNAYVAKMVEAIDACEQNLDDVDGFRTADVQFHRVLAEVPGNPIFVALHETFVDRLMTNRAVLPDYRDRNRASNTEHREIVSAILDKDADLAEKVLTQHLTRNYGTYFRLSLVEKNAPQANENPSKLKEMTYE